MSIILSYILIRLFVPKRYTLEGDELRHLATAKNFYKLWNRSFYDMHPPFYSWLVRLFKSGVVVSFLCSVGLFLISAKLYDVLGLNPSQKNLALIFLTFNYTLIYYSNRTFRYQLIALLGTGLIYALIIGKYFVAGLLWGLLGLTCTFAGLRGFFIWGAVGFNWISVITFVIIYSSWFISKAQVYRKHEYYPSGVEGMMEQVNHFTLKQLFSPLYFDWSYDYYGKGELGYTLRGWLKRIGGVWGLYPPLTILVPVAIFFTVKGALGTPTLGILTLCLLYPSLLKRFLPRNSIVAIPLIGYFLAKGLPQMSVVWPYFAFLIGLCVFLCFNRVFLLTRPKIRCRRLAAYIQTLPRDGFIVDGMFCQPLAYLTDKRIVVIPRDPDPDKACYQTAVAIKEFDLSYAVISDKYHYPAMDYIRDFKKIGIVEEDDETFTIFETKLS